MCFTGDHQDIKNKKQPIFVFYYFHIQVFISCVLFDFFGYCLTNAFFLRESLNCELV